MMFRECTNLIKIYGCNPLSLPIKIIDFCNFWLSHDDRSQVECEDEGETWDDEGRAYYHAYDEGSDREK
jgi:hypothetical protein